MAGIGFRLKKILDKDTYFASIKAYLYSALISSGPWLITIVAIGIVGASQAGRISTQQSGLFRVTIVYVYTLTLITLGVVQMPLTRYLADLLFSGNTKLFLPTYVGSLILLGCVQTVFVLPACLYFSGWDLAYGLHVWIFYMSVSFTWVAMIFLSAARNYHAIVAAFFVGALTSVLLGSLMGSTYGLNGYMTGYTLGRVLLLLILTARIVREFPSDTAISYDFLRYLKRYVPLVIIGFFYNLSIWVDKMLFWFGPYGQRVDRFLFACSSYDLPMYLSYLTIVPSMAIFLIRTETSFVRYYQAFYGAIVGKQDFTAIRSLKEAMVDHIKLSLTSLLKIQGLVSALAFLAIPYLSRYLGLVLPNENTLRFGIIGAFFHILLLILSIYLLYFDFQKETLVLTATYLVLNTGLTYVSQRLGEAYFGLGYCTACFAALMLGVAILMYKLRRLEYITFVQQPVQ